MVYIGTDNALYEHWQRAPNDGWSGEETLWDVNQGVDPATLVAQDLAVVSSNEDPLLLDVFYIDLDNALHHAFA